MTDATRAWTPPKRPGQAVRFRLVDDTGQTSAAWRVWTGRTRDDVYMAERGSGDLVKASFHESGVSQYGVSVSGARALGVDPSNRLFARWIERAEAQPGWRLLAQLVVARSELRVGDTPPDSRVGDVPMPRPDEDSAVVELWREASDAPPFVAQRATPVGVLALPSGDHVWILSHAVRLPWSVETKFHVQKAEARADQSPALPSDQAPRAVVYAVDEPTGALQLVELAID